MEQNVIVIHHFHNEMITRKGVFLFYLTGDRSSVSARVFERTGVQRLHIRQFFFHRLAQQLRESKNIPHSLYNYQLNLITQLSLINNTYNHRLVQI